MSLLISYAYKPGNEKAFLRCVWTIALFLSVTIASWAATPEAWAQLPTARLDTLWPIGATAGTEFDLTIDGGEFIDEAHALLLSSPTITWTVLTDEPRVGRSERVPRSGQFHLVVPATQPEGIVDVRTAGRYGVTNTRRLWVSHLPTITASAPRNSTETALPIACNQIVQGRLTGEQLDHYTIPLRQGQNLRLTVRALQLDSAASITVIIRDSSGKEHLRSRSSKSVDATADWIVPQDGTYTLQVHDLLFRGGNEFFYQLEVTENPNAETKRAPDIATADSTDVPRVPFPAQHSFAIPQSGTPIRCDVALQAGQRVLVAVDTPPSSPATDLQLVIERVFAEPDKPVRFEKIAEQDDYVQLNGSSMQQRDTDPLVFFTAPATGDYRLTIRDLQSTSNNGETKQVELSIDSPKPSFEVFAMLPHASNNPTQSLHHGYFARRGQHVAIEVGVEAIAGFFDDLKGEVTLIDGLVKVPYDIPWVWPIEVTAEGLPEGISCQLAKLDRNHRRSFVVLTIGDSAPAWSGPINLIASVKTDQSELRKQVRWLEMRRPDPQGKGRIPISEVDSVHLAVTDTETMPLTIELGSAESKAFQGKRGTAIKVPVKIVRSEATKGKVTLRPLGLPADVSSGEIALEGETLQGEIQINLGGNAVLGTFRFLLNAEVETPWPRNPQALDRERAYVQELETLLASAEESSKAMLEQAIQQGRERIKQLEESTKPQNTRAFILSNSIEVTVDAQ